MLDHFLYHGSPYLFDSLRLDDREQTKNGETRCWAFATHLRNHALPYTLVPRWSFMSTEHTELGRSLTIVVSENRDLLLKPFEAYLHCLAPATFARVIDPSGPSNEWVSASAVAINTDESERIASLDQLMAEDVQLFASARPMEKMDFMATFENPGSKAEIMDKTARGELIWENLVRGINHAPELQKYLPAPLSAPKLRPNTRRFKPF